MVAKSVPKLKIYTKLEDAIANYILQFTLTFIMKVLYSSLRSVIAETYLTLVAAVIRNFFARMY